MSESPPPGRTAVARFGVAIHGLVLLVFGALVWLLYAPPTGWTHRFFLGAGGDPWIFIWFLDWWPYALHHALSPFSTALVDAPAGSLLAWRTSIPALALPAAPATRAWGGLAVYNGLMLAAPALAAWGAWLAALELTRSRPAAFLAGLVFGFSSYEVGQMMNHLNLAFTVAVPLLVWACLRAHRRAWGPARLGGVLGVLLTFQFGVSQEIFAASCVFGAIAAAILWARLPGVRPALRRLCPGVLAGLGLAALLLSPLLIAMLAQYGSSQGRIAPPGSLVNDVLSFVVPAPTAWLGGAHFPWARHIVHRDDELVAYTGLPLLVLLGGIFLAARERPAERALCLVALAAAIASLGPYLQIAGVRISTAPWIVFSYLPFVKAILPGRLILFGWLAVALVLALWVARPGRGPSRPLRYALAAAALLFAVPAPGFARLWSPVVVPDVVSGPAALAPGSRVLFLPDAGDAVRYLSAGGFAYQLMGQGYLGNGQPQPFARWTLFGPLSANAFEQIDPAAFAAYLAHYGTDRVVVLKEGFLRRLPGMPPDRAAAAERLLRAAGWEVAGETADALLFRASTGGLAATPAELSAWMNRREAEQLARRLKAEAGWVCGLRGAMRWLRLDPAFSLRLYARLASPPRPVEEVPCQK